METVLDQELIDRLEHWIAEARSTVPFHKRTGRIIKLLTVQEILDEEHVQKM